MPLSEGASLLHIPKQLEQEPSNQRQLLPRSGSVQPPDAVSPAMTPPLEIKDQLRGVTDLDRSAE